MTKEKTDLIEELTWKDVRNDVAKNCKTLTKIIDDISPDKELTLFKARYPFGTKIFDKNSFCLPKRLDAQEENKNENKIKSKLAYNAMPLGIIVKNSAEAFFDLQKKIFSFTLFNKGLEMGVREYLGHSVPYSINSGARSLYMLPKISEMLSHKQLKKRFGVIESPPKSFYNHWQVFSQIANSDEFSSPWFCEIIFLPAKWIDLIKTDESWSKLDCYIHKKGWELSEYERKKMAFDLVWEDFVKSLSNKDLKFDPYIVDTLKHMIYIVTSMLPASTPSIGDDQTGPLKNIQMIYEDSSGYGLNEYIATIMHPSYFSCVNEKPVYYSLQLPTLLESLPKTKKITSVIDNVRELSELLNHFLNNSFETWSNLMLGETTFSEILKNLQIDFFHGDMFAYGNIIKSSSKMPDFDTDLKFDPINDSKRKFANNSSFLRGCVKIASKNNAR